jgi:hypothetical protein
VPNFYFRVYLNAQVYKIVKGGMKVCSQNPFYIFQSIMKGLVVVVVV